MNLTDFIVIYLACGAPFGVYYFFQNRARHEPRSLWLKTFLNFVFWIPFAVRLMLNRKPIQPSFVFESNSSAAGLQTSFKQLESILRDSDLKISVYEFREVLERYIGLTTAAQAESAPDQATTEIYRIAENAQIELGAICLQRRNRQRLIRHQTEARRDFLQIIKQLLDVAANEKILVSSAINLVEILDDRAARIELEKIFARRAQTAAERNVSNTEKDLWKPETPRLSPVKQILYRSPDLNPTLSLRKKD